MAAQPYKRNRKFQTTVQLDPDQMDAVIDEATRQRTSVASIMRQAVDALLRHDTPVDEPADRQAA